MKKLPFPPIDDAAATTETAHNRRLDRTSYPHLRDALEDILGAYQQYDEYGGNALHIKPIEIEDALKKGLLANYGSPPSSLCYIGDIRNSSPAVCPMCGSLKTTSLDHLCPKEDYPEYAVYSRNLLPACDCNTKRGRVLKDEAKDVRILHPYYDSCLTERQLSCLIDAAPAFPLVEINIRFVQPASELIDSIRFHVRKVLIPSGVIGWLSSQWASLVECPSSVIHTLPHRQLVDDGEFRACLTDALDRYDKSIGTPNNWCSIFVHGLLESPSVTPWLLDKHNVDYN